MEKVRERNHILKNFIEMFWNVDKEDSRVVDLLGQTIKIDELNVNDKQLNILKKSQREIIGAYEKKYSIIPETISNTIKKVRTVLERQSGEEIDMKSRSVQKNQGQERE